MYAGSAVKESPLRGRNGLTLRGVNIYGPLEAVRGTGSSASPASNVLTQLFLDTCGGHANSYHYHGDPTGSTAQCDYDAEASRHSPLIGLALDGYGIYGLKETGHSPCRPRRVRGHVGYVLADEENGVPAGTYYHYHVQNKPPYTLGCYGRPLTTVEECKAASSTCDTDFTIIANAKGVLSCYNLECTCFDPVLGNNTHYSAQECQALPNYQSTFLGGGNFEVPTRAGDGKQGEPVPGDTSGGDSNTVWISCCVGTCFSFFDRGRSLGLLVVQAHCEPCSRHHRLMC